MVSANVSISYLVDFHFLLDTIIQSFPLGMENGLIMDSQLNASSEKYYYFSGAASGRFNSKTMPNHRLGGWIAAEDDTAPWFQVNFINNATITAIVTQGLETGENYVKEYTVAFNSSETGFQNYTDRSTGIATVRIYEIVYACALYTGIMKKSFVYS